MTWCARIDISKQDNGYYHLSASTLGSDQDEALAAAKFIKAEFSTGRSTLMRAEPEAGSDVNFDTKEELHRGYVRFTFRCEPGALIDASDQVVQVTGFGIP